MPKARIQDHLTRDVLAAEAAGMSYGKWKTLNPHTPEWDEIEVDPEPQTGEAIECRGCGALFIPENVQRKYCSDQCRARTVQRRYRENHPPKLLTCRICGKSMTGRRSKQYCSDACSIRGYRQKVAARREAKGA